jgi:hypothetical protein
MSQLIAGYIDIILKTRREAVRAAEEDGAETANAETLAHTTGSLPSSTYSSFCACVWY